ncbi:MAG: 3-deoxy-D-manno-octulosonate 8-phosphate phosphatase [Ignavibacteriae bacterium HGW-Ignavibacteriae-3]|nr:MAG: 3-deoxy-D-manno-octulosonate 8-phosphate phosphatase [Ignavibacteriae bacterium HGW-Ignavibacteriae-3]
MLLTDVDGVLTDAGVYYSSNGELMKRFSIRDGMGVELLRKQVNVETGIITREDTLIVKTRANRLGIKELHMGILDKLKTLEEIIARKKIKAEEIAFIGDDVNDVEILKSVGLSACPNDATKIVKGVADMIVESKGGHGAFRDLADFIIEAKTDKKGKQ